MNLEAVKEELIDADEEFRSLHLRHQDLEQRLESLYQKSLPSQEDEVEIKSIKRQKLRLKDQMMALATAHESRVTA